MADFSYIGKVATQAVDDGPKPIHVQYVGGFPVSTVQKPSQTWVSTAEEYDGAAARLQGRLTKAGVAPLTIFPLKWWNGICDGAGLSNLDIDAKGMVAVNPNLEAKKVGETLPWYAAWLGFSLFSAYVLLVIRSRSLIHLRLDGLELYGTFLALFSAIFGLVLVAACTGLLPKSLRVRWRVLVHLLIHGNRKVMSRMLADGKTSRSMMVPVALPTPPEDVAAILAKLAPHLPVYVAVKPGSVRIGGGAWGILHAYLCDRDKVEFKRPNPKPVSAILYTTEYLAVAIIAEIGDVPIDQRMVDRVIQQRDTLRLT
ncbi:MAG: hypothetical protein EOP83_28005 [Verrucomicrobiaceae bacterium]|nr:MAG: hypothetical protein EOP83_28005 [Verrucomicrobiaceae bacterium]